jgi:translation initiation factor IF-2
MTCFRAGQVEVAGVSAALAWRGRGQDQDHPDAQGNERDPAQDSHGKSRTVQVEVRKKRVLVKRDSPTRGFRCHRRRSPVAPPQSSRRRTRWSKSSPRQPRSGGRAAPRWSSKQSAAGRRRPTPEVAELKKLKAELKAEVRAEVVEAVEPPPAVAVKAEAVVPVKAPAAKPARAEDRPKRRSRQRRNRRCRSSPRRCGGRRSQAAPRRW